MDSVEEPHRGYAAVLVDVVGSRDHPDRAALQRAVQTAADRANAAAPGLDPLTATVGDELQATYAGVMDAIAAVVRLRLELIGMVDVRASIGWGSIEIHDPARTPFGQDGPAWWAARAALERLSDGTDRWDSRLAVAYADPVPSSTDGVGGLAPPRPLDAPAVDLVRSHLILLDHALAGLDRVEARILLGDLESRTTDEIAAEVGISASGVSQRRRRNNLRALAAAVDALHTPS